MGMNRSGKALAAAAVFAMAASGALSTTGSAVAVSPDPQVWSISYDASDSVTPPAELVGPDGEQPTEWGMFVYPADTETGTVQPTVVESVGGGTWNHGTGAGLGGGHGKKCWSNYYHSKKKHSATAILSSQNVRTTKAAGVWANSTAYGGTAHTCYTYWGVY
ncbi:lactococcin 972 family bacteriocin [Streptomyces sp. NPDC098077]|uniref:lactococcin 972 family bacteriocin n=1 Tax=Streptomyces sp. NPDC098077 TaxID=3366093 RepID=UPI0037F6F376